MPTNSFEGTWRLVSAVTKTTSGEITHPFGKDAVGYLIYSQGGYMAVAIMQPNRTNFASADIRAGSLEERVAAFDTYVSYCGTYEVKGDKIVHHVELSLFPNWSGVDQERFFEISGDQLTLRTAPMTMEGVERTAHLIWHRASAHR